MSKGTEKIFFFSGSKGRRILGILYHPDPLHTRKTGIVYCHPFAEEQNMAHPVAVKACRAFSRAGYPVLRFDMSGCGDSEGSLDEMDISSWLEDIHSAVEGIKRESGVQEAGLFGLRLGAGLALLHAARNDAAIPFLILWEPVLDFSLYISQFLRRAVASRIVANSANGTNVQTLEQQLIEQGRVDVIGYPVSKGLFDSFCAISKDPMNYKPRCHSLVLSISQMDKPSAKIIEYQELHKSAQTEAVFDHIKAEPFWDRYWRSECPEVIQRTVQWLLDRR